jgi:dihydrofolate reductase
MAGICVALVVAVSKNGIIGRAGKLPWRLSSDVRFFKKITMGKPIIMGRKTWESLPRRPLPGRDNIVLTRQADYKAEGAIVVRDVETALSTARTLAGRAGVDEIAVIGGAEIYQLFLPIAHRIYLTVVDLHVEGDTRFPSFDPAQWKDIGQDAFAKGEGDDADFVIRTLDRRFK